MANQLYKDKNAYKKRSFAPARPSIVAGSLPVYQVQSREAVKPWSIGMDSMDVDSMDVDSVPVDSIGMDSMDVDSVDSGSYSMSMDSVPVDSVDSGR